MATTMWDQLKRRALEAARINGDPDILAGELLSASGGDRRSVLAARLRLAADMADDDAGPDMARAVALVDRAIAKGDREALWHPVFGDLDPWQFARHHASA